jgi:type VI protein secretion system component VasK
MSEPMPPAMICGFNLDSKPTHSGYFWCAVAASFCSLLGLGKLAFKVSQNHQLLAISAPILVLTPIFLIWQAVRTIRIIRAARAQRSAGNEQLEKRAGDSFRGYLTVNAIVVAATWWLISSN